jgi:hypothetical protein
MLPYVNAIATLLYCIYLMDSLHHTLLDCCKYLMMQSYFWLMVHMKANEEATHDILEGSTGHGRWQAPRGNATPPPPRPSVSLEQLLTPLNELIRVLMENEACRGAGHP